MNISAILTLQRQKSGEQQNDINILVAKSLIFIIENFFLHLAPSFVLTLSCHRRSTCNFYNNLLEKLFRLWDHPPMQIVKMPEIGSIYVPGRRDFNLVLVDSYESFRAIDVIKYTAKYNTNEYYYIFLQTRDSRIPAEMSRIFQYCWKNYIINCNVQVQSASGEILIYTYYPYTKDNCGKPMSKLINFYNGTTLVHKVIFPKKLLNFHGCKLRAAIWNVPPFIYLEKNRNGMLEIKRGIEARVILELAHKLNFVIEVLLPPNDEQRGEVKGTNLTGALAMLEKRIADFSLGCFRIAYDRSIVTTYTFSHYQSSQIICAAMKAYALSSGKILIYPFTFSTWLLLLVIMALSVATVATINKYFRLYPALFSGYTPTHSQLNVVLMTFGLPATRMPKQIFARLLCTNWMIFALIIRTAYQALLFHLIRTKPINGIPSSLNELVQHNDTVVVSRATYMDLRDVQFLSELTLKVINDVDETAAFRYIDKYSQEHLLAAGPLDFLAYYAIKFKKTSALRLLSQHIVSLPLTIYLTKHSYLINQFDEELMNMRSKGLIDIWSRWELNFHYLESEDTDDDALFGINELYMILTIGILGLTISSFVFLLEILSPRVACLKRFFNEN